MKVAFGLSLEGQQWAVSVWQDKNGRLNRVTKAENIRCTFRSYLYPPQISTTFLVGRLAITSEDIIIANCSLLKFKCLLSATFLHQSITARKFMCLGDTTGILVHRSVLESISILYRQNGTL